MGIVTGVVLFVRAVFIDRCPSGIFRPCCCQKTYAFRVQQPDRLR